MNLYYLGGNSSWQTHLKNTKTVVSKNYINASSISKKRKKISGKTVKIVIFQASILLAIISEKIGKKVFYLLDNGFVNIHSSTCNFFPSE